MRLRFAALFAVLAVGLFVASGLVPSPFVTAYRQPYAGERIDRLPVRIEKEGTYEVELEVPHGLYWSIAQNGNAPLIVTAPVGHPYRGMADGGETVSFRVYWIKAKEGETVPLTVSPGSSFRLYRSGSPCLVVRRVPFGYALYFIETLALQALALLSLLLAGLLGLSPLVARSRRAA